MRYRIQIERDGRQLHVSGKAKDFYLTGDIRESSSFYFPEVCEIMGGLDHQWESNTKERVADQITLFVLTKY